MGEALYINVFHRVTDEDAERQLILPICTIVRTCDIQQAYDAALAFTDAANIVNGAYEGMPLLEFNGPGHFAKALLAYINNSWEQYTSLGAVPDDEGDGDWGDEDMVLNIVCDAEGKPYHGVYDASFSDT
jgi:hypothetical protein